MAVTIRLARHGRKKRPFYRVIVADRDMPRDGRFLELVGTLNPLTDPPTVNLKEDRVKYWLGVGAQPSDTASKVIDKLIPGYIKGIEDTRRERLRSRRAKRKAAASKSK